ncbi:energy transducer TonB [Stieleria varia]|nr:energy transducer TonB [Stieleria varia]
MNLPVRRHRLIANSVSLTTHAGLLLVAGLVTAPAVLWQTNVNRGRSTTLIVSIESTTSVAQPIANVQPIVTEAETEPPAPVETAQSETVPVDRLPDEVPEHRPAESASLAAMTAPEPEPLPVVSANLPPPPAMTEKMPVTVEPEKKRRKKKTVASAALHASLMAPPPIDAPTGANYDTPPSKLPENEPPNYPDDAQAAGHEGRVVLVVTVKSDGSVADIAVATSSGFGVLDSAALEAVFQWRFSPAKFRGLPVTAEILVPIRFTLGAKS